MSTRTRTYHDERQAASLGDDEPLPADALDLVVVATQFLERPVEHAAFGQAARRASIISQTADLHQVACSAAFRDRTSEVVEYLECDVADDDVCVRFVRVHAPNVALVLRA